MVRIIDKFTDTTEGGMPHLPGGLFTGIALCLPVILWLYSVKTRGGLRMVAVGADPDKSRMMGLRPSLIRFWALVATGVFTGLAGAMLVSDTLSETRAPWTGAHSRST